MSKGATQPTVRETADKTEKSDLNSNVAKNSQQNTSRGKHKSKQSPEDDHVTQGKTKNQLQDERGGKGHSGHSSSRNGSGSNSEKDDSK